jgi:signal transduction histidine kinase
VIRIPHPLVAGLVATSAIVTAALVWSSWRLAEQQRALDARIAGEQAEAAADAMAARLRERLAHAGERLGARLSGTRDTAPGSFSRDLIVVVADRSRVTVDPAGALPFVPVVPTPTSASTLFDGGESAEFGGADLDLAEKRYRSLTNVADPVVRAGALERLARVLRKTGRAAAAVATSEQLAALDDVRTDTTGVPATLAGLDGARLAYRQLGDTANEARVAEDIRQGIDEGRWAIARGMADFYREAVSDAPRPESWRVAEAIADAWPVGSDGVPGRGQLIAAGNGHPVMLIWRANDETVAMGAAFVDAFVGNNDVAAWQLRDADDRLLAGAGTPGAGAPINRIISGGGAAWTLRVFSSTASPAMAGGRRRVILGALAAMLGVVWGATYLMARAIRREADVSRLQTDFVAAVSHEFRSPLTTLRQMTEMLHGGRVLDESRRQQYYGVLVSETARLQRLVETLLNFGGMESGASPYRLADLDVAAVVDAAVADVRSQMGAGRTRIELDGRSAAPVRVHGDPDALRLALRNLLDNAVKYSPETSTVRVSWRAHDQAVAIEVADQGRGIEPDEQTRIFRKFVRGRAAAESRVPGTGIGLAMVRGIASAHGGDIRLRSRPGHGSVFTLVVPRAAGAEPNPEAVVSPLNEAIAPPKGSLGA